MMVEPDLVALVRAVAHTESIPLTASIDKIVRMGLSRWQALRKYAGKSGRLQPKQKRKQ